MPNKKKLKKRRFFQRSGNKKDKENSKSPNDNLDKTNNKTHHEKHKNHSKKHKNNHKQNKKHHLKTNHKIDSKDNHKEKAIGKTLESYEIILDNVKVIVNIKKTILGPTYQLEVPEINIATASLLDEVRNELVTATTVGMNEITDPNAFLGIKKRFMIEARRILKEKLPNIEKNMEEFLVGKLMQDMLGLGEIEFLVNDVNLEEVVITSAKEPIRVYHKKYGWLKSNLKIDREDKIVNYSNIIARRVGRQINVLAPLLDAHLITGDRINSILYPISTKGNTITIRKFARDPYTIIDLINNKTLDLEVAALLWLAIEYEMNVLISDA